jgi:hypothetical protein
MYGIYTTPCGEEVVEAVNMVWGMSCDVLPQGDASSFPRVSVAI